MDSLRRVRPWPYDVVINADGFLLQADPQSNVLLSAPKVQPMGLVTGAEYNYSSVPPFDERTYQFRNLRLGMGEKIQASQTPTRYRYALGCDLSIDGMAILGPAFTIIHPAASTGPVRWFRPMDLPQYGTIKIVCGSGSNVLVRNGDNATDWILSATLDGAALSATLWQGSGPHRGLYVGSGASSIWEFTGASDTTVWTNLTAATTGLNGGLVTSNNRELWRAWGPFAYRCTADPSVNTNWTASIAVGRSDSGVTAMEPMFNVVYFFKQDGVYTLNANTDGSLAGTSNELFPMLRQNEQGSTSVAHFQDGLFFSWGDAYYKLGPPPIFGPLPLASTRLERFALADSEVRGRITAAASYGAWFLFCGLLSPSGDSYVLKYGAWISDPADPSGGQYLPVWNGALAKFPGRTISAMFVAESPLDPRLYLGFDDGTIGWCVLPEGSPNPINDPRCTYQGTGQVYWPLHHGMFQRDTKAWRGASAFGPRLDTQNYVQVEYRQEGQGAWFGLGAQFTTNGQRWDFPKSTVGNLIEVRTDLIGTGSTTPVVEGIGFHEAVRPALLLERDFTVPARSDLVRHDGGKVLRSARQIRDRLRNFAEAAGTVEMLLPDGKKVEVQVVDYNEQITAALATPQWLCTFKGIEYVLFTPRGTIDCLGGRSVDSLSGITCDALRGLTQVIEPRSGIIDTLMGYRVDDLGPYTIAQLEGVHH